MGPKSQEKEVHLFVLAFAIKERKEKKKGGLKMARLNINISDRLNEQMREYIKENNLTITIFLHLAISKYIEIQEQAKK